MPKLETTSNRGPATVIRRALGVVMVFPILYLIAVGVMFAYQRSFIYPAPANRAFRGSAPIGSRDIRIVTSDGLSLHATYRAARGLPTIVFFHGNGDSLLGANLATQALGEKGYGLLLPEYRGYGGNGGVPSEEGLYRDGRAAMLWLKQHNVDPANVVVVGNSLGSGVATELATEQKVLGLVIVSGFTSLADVAAPQVWWMPVRWLLRDRYENLSKVRRLDIPILVLHGVGDTLIPTSHGIALARGARHATLVTVPLAGHELAYLPQSQQAVEQWLRKVTPTRH